MLTDLTCRSATCPPEKRHDRFHDAQGLYLEVAKTGSKRWFYKFVMNRKEGRLALGSYPEVSLSQARVARDEARLEQKKGVNPVHLRKAKKLKASTASSETFEAVAGDWYKKQLPVWSPSHAKRMKEQLDRDLTPYIGSLPMEKIVPMQLLAALKRVEARGAVETAHRVLSLASQVWEYWLPIAPDGCRDISVGLKGRLKKYTGKHYPAIVEPLRFGELLRSIRSYKGGFIVRVALQLAPLLYQRPGNLRMMEWTELDLDAGEWRIASSKMKRTVEEKSNGDDHIVPLPRQAVALLKEIEPLTGHKKYVFPGERHRDRSMSDGTLRAALYGLGYGREQSVHGFRASARTMLAEQLDVDPLVMEAHMAHAVKDTNGRSYNRTKYLKQRAAMAQQWADYCDKLANGAEVIAMPLAA